MKIASYLGIALAIASMGYKAASRMNPECHCYLFQSAGLSHGSFKSPNFPRFYPISIGCILYIFVGALDELVELTLYEFDMRPKSKDGKCGDYFRLFLNLDRPELNEKDRWEFEHCGELTSLSQSVFYSRHRVIIAEFHSSGDIGFNYKYRGFKGNFKFLKRGRYKVDGERLDDHPCRFRFDARSSSAGEFFSPNYPQNYPNNTNCVFEFIAGATQRIIVDFATIALHPSRGRCDPVSAGDRLVVYDGLSKLDRVLARYCGAVRVRQVVSHGNRLSVRLYSDGDGVQAQGFSGRYQFVNRHTVQPTRLLDDTMRGDGHAPEPVIIKEESPVSHCSHQFHSNDDRKSGTFELAESPYPPKSSCTFTFRGKPGEHVVIDFLSVQLDEANPKQCRSHSGDRIDVYDGISDAQKWLKVICGKTSNLQVVSSGSSVTVKFESDAITAPSESGFKAKYAFVSEEELRKEMSTPAKENYSGKTPSTSATAGDCRHQIISQKKEKTGVIETPGYPNGFKKDAVCYWLFYGQSNERIRIKFLDFSLNKERDLISRLPSVFLPKDSCAGRDRVQVFKFYYQSAIGQIKRNEAPVEYCGKTDAAPVMSGKRSRLDVIFHSVAGSQGTARGVRFRYTFVTDYGVKAVGAKQKPDSCSFQFSGFHTNNGSFTSPNYPGHYPDDLVCDYIFKGRRHQLISISFADFSLASIGTGESCSESTGDYIEVLSCYQSPGYQVVTADYHGPQRFCRHPPRGSIYRIDWPYSCLHLRFHSNSVDTKRGFFAYYSFYYDSDFVERSRYNKGKKTHNLCLTMMLMIFTNVLCALLGFR